MGKVKTYISGLDELIEGGLIKNSTTLITGKTGTGKSSFCVSFIYFGAMNDEPGIYVLTEETKQSLKEESKNVFGFELEKLEEQNLLKVLSIKPEFPTQVSSIEETKILKIYIYDLVDQISELVKEINAKRVVLDSTSILELFVKDKYLGRIAIAYLINSLKEMNVTSFLVGTIPESGEDLSTLGIIEFLVDGIIKLEFVPIAEEFKRTLVVRKMRQVNHSTLIHPFEITGEGIKILKIT
jgi:KaiC/GvpD/RAD55 family RecA-like ATPase